MLFVSSKTSTLCTNVSGREGTRREFLFLDDIFLTENEQQAEYEREVWFK